MFEAAAIILAGGKASRLKGVDKARMVINAGPLLEEKLECLRRWFAEVLVVAGNRRQYDYPQVRQVPDERSGWGPLMGLYSGLKASTYDINFVTACDMPFINQNLLKFMMQQTRDYDVVVPIVNHLPEPLVAFYHRRVLSPVQETLARDRRKMVAFYNMVHVCEIPEEKIRTLDPELKSFVNINTPEDLSRVQQMLNEEKYNQKAPSARRGTSSPPPT
jgi:molybdopterin-guanine dinucleotide biosynthesis protein A